MITSIKGFDKNLSCRGFQFEIGKTYKVKGKVKVCSNGFHSCPSDEDTGPLSVFEYYPPATSRYCEVQAEGNTDRQGNKIASAKITVGVEITLHELIGRFINWATNKAGGTLAASNSVDYGAASNSGDSGAASNSGDYGAAMSHAYGGKVMCEGDGQALYCSEFDVNFKLVSNACGITGQDGIRAGVWYTCKGGKLVEVA